MNVSQIHERLRTETLRRLQRGNLTAGMLAKRAGVGRSHLSNFLRARAQLSGKAFDRMLAAQGLGVEDLIGFGSDLQAPNMPSEAIPLVSHDSALFEPIIQPGAERPMFHVPPGDLHSLRPRPVRSRRLWRRFVAVRIDYHDAISMEPLLYAGAIVVIDRHYNHLEPCNPPRRNLYAISDRGRLMLRYIDVVGNHLVARTLATTSPPFLVEMAPEANPGEYIAGRVAGIYNKP